MSVTMSGKLKGNLDALKNRLVGKVVPAVQVMSDEYLRLAKAFCPFLTGALRDSGAVKTIPDGINTVFQVGFAWKDFEFPRGMYVVPEGHMFAGQDRADQPPHFYAVIVSNRQIQQTGLSWLELPLNLAGARNQLVKTLHEALK